MKAKMIFIGKKQKKIFFEKPKYQIQKWSFLIYTNIQFTIMEHFLQFKACKSGENDAIGIKGCGSTDKSVRLSDKRLFYY